VAKIRWKETNDCDPDQIEQNEESYAQSVIKNW
jgi:hypothetical protein